MPSVFAVVLTYNRSTLLKQCLKAIADQTYQCDRIIIVDNASTDDTLEVLKSEMQDRVTIVALPKNVGAAGGFNIGKIIALGILDPAVLAGNEKRVLGHG